MEENEEGRGYKMKSVEELGISPTPWKNIGVDNNPFGFVRITDKDGFFVADVDGESDENEYANAHLIAAAPKLYEELRQEMERRYCVKCKHSVWTKRGGIEIMTGCDGKGACPKPSWKKVLAEASEEVVC